MKKETLTTEKVKSDLGIVKRLRAPDIAVYIVGSVLIGIIVLLVTIGALAEELGNARYVFSTIYLLFLLLLIGDCVYRFCLRAQCKRLATSGNFLIKKGALKKKICLSSYKRPYYATYIFWFSKYGYYELSLSPEDWDKIYNGIVIGGLFRSSEPGDVFYLICNKRGKVLIAYPAKLFELSEVEG